MFEMYTNQLFVIFKLQTFAYCFILLDMIIFYISNFAHNNLRIKTNHLR